VHLLCKTGVKRYFDNGVIVAQSQKCQKKLSAHYKDQHWTLCKGPFYYRRAIIFILLTTWHKCCGKVQELLCSDWIYYCRVSKCVQ